MYSEKPKTSLCHFFNKKKRRRRSHYSAASVASIRAARQQAAVQRLRFVPERKQEERIQSSSLCLNGQVTSRLTGVCKTNGSSPRSRFTIRFQACVSGPRVNGGERAGRPASVLRSCRARRAGSSPWPRVPRGWHWLLLGLDGWVLGHS